jgi:hypothetical protein
MKKLKFILLVICLIFAVNTKTYGNSAFKYWERVMDAISYVESKHNPNAKNGIYVGCLQIGPGMVHECNNILKKENSEIRYTLNDRLNPIKSREMFIIF